MDGMEEERQRVGRRWKRKTFENKEIKNPPFNKKKLQDPLPSPY